MEVTVLATLIAPRHRLGIPLGLVWVSWLSILLLGTAHAASVPVTLRWTPNPAPNIAGYRVFFGSPPGNFDRAITCAADQSQTVLTDLGPGRPYGFQVVCFDTLGLESPPSATAIYTTPGRNNAPTARSATYQVSEGDTLSILLSGSDADGDPLTYALLTPPLRGIVTGTPPTLEYRAPAQGNVQDTFAFVVSDGVIHNFGIITLHVGSNPRATRLDLPPTNEDIPQILPLPETDNAGNPLVYRIRSEPRHGKLTGSSPSYTYHPDPEFSGTDDATLSATNQFSQTFTFLVGFTVRDVDDPPVAHPLDVQAKVGSSTLIPLGGEDIDSTDLDFRIVRPPTQGRLSGQVPALTYTPKPGYVGPDGFEFTVSDGTSTSAPALVSIRVEASSNPVLADAGPDQTVTLPALGLLRANLIPNGPMPDEAEIVTLWQQLDGPAFASVANHTARTTAVSFTEPGDYTFLLQVASGGEVADDAVRIQVKSLASPPPGTTPFTLYLEAESGFRLPPMRVFSDDPSDPTAPRWVASTESDSGSVTFDLPIPHDGEFVLWARARTDGPDADSLFVSVDTTPPITDISDLDEAGVDTTTWQWVLLPGRGGPDQNNAKAATVLPLVLALHAGTHSLSLSGRDLGPRIDKLVVTQDPTFDPQQVENSIDRPSLTVLPTSNGQIELRWTSIVGRRYQVLLKRSLADTEWTPIGTPFRATSSTSTRFVSPPGAPGPVFYSLLSLP